MRIRNCVCDKCRMTFFDAGNGSVCPMCQLRELLLELSEKLSPEQALALGKILDSLPKWKEDEGTRSPDGGT